MPSIVKTLKTIYKRIVSFIQKILGDSEKTANSKVEKALSLFNDVLDKIKEAKDALKIAYDQKNQKIVQTKEERETVYSEYTELISDYEATKDILGEKYHKLRKFEKNLENLIGSED